MIGIENQHSGSLRVMRFGFEPNPPLLDQLQAQLEPTRRLSTPIHLYASSQLLISLDDYYENEEEIFKIGRRFSDRRAALNVIPNLTSKELPKSPLTRLRLRPVAQEEFDALFAKMKSLPNLIRDQPAEGHYIFADVATEALLSGSARNVARDKLEKEGKKRRFAVETTRFVIQRDINPSIPEQVKLPPTPLDDLPKAI